VNYSAQKWENNTPNNTANSPRYTIVSASGTKIGTHANRYGTAYEYDGPKNPFPGSANVTSKEIVSKPLLNIKEAKSLITLTYIEEGGHEALEQGIADVRAQKFIRDGQLVIVRDGIEYNAIGVRIQ